jgi:mono/diheme cytochrome c family protein
VTKKSLGTLAFLMLIPLAGCGGGGVDALETTPDGVKVDGKAVFVDAGCTACHTLKAADAGGVTGPNLDKRRPDADEVANKVKSGGGGMPAYDGQLTDPEIRAVADYIAANAGR